MNEFFKQTIFTINDQEIRLGSIFILIFFIAAIVLILKLIKAAIDRYDVFDRAKKYSIYLLIKYFVYVLSVSVSLQILGFDISILIAGSAALLVGLGLGIQNLFSDYVSGIIILFDNSIKIGDIIEVNNVVCKVIEINLRSTLVLTRDDKYIILPNTDLTRNPLVNWTHNADFARFEVSVGVAYNSDIELVKRILKAAALEHPLVIKSQEPFVRIEDFGQSALSFTLFFWSEEVFRVENLKSNIREKIIADFRKENIEIPFPQRVIHVNNK